MKAFYEQFRTLRTKHNVTWELLEQDYLLSWILAGIAAVPDLKDLLIFKGGTALKKAYFGNYRYSQDLDFSCIKTLPDDAILELLINTACTKAMELQRTYGYPLEIACQKYTEKRPHPHNQKAFTIMGKFPWHRDQYTRVMIEISTQEVVLLPSPERKIIHAFCNELLDVSLHTYALEEIVAEKIRAILQFAAKLHERGWARSRARDYYDLWRILYDYRDSLDTQALPILVEQKCTAKNIIFPGPDALFSDKLMANLDEAWARWLAPFVPGLPQKAKVLQELHSALHSIWYPAKT